MSAATVWVDRWGRVFVRPPRIRLSAGAETAPPRGRSGEPAVSEEPSDRRTDVYGLGLTLWELLERGHRDDGTFDSRTRRHASDPLVDVAMRALSVDPRQRQATVADFLQALRDALGIATPPEPWTVREADRMLWEETMAPCHATDPTTVQARGIVAIDAEPPPLPAPEPPPDEPTLDIASVPEASQPDATVWQATDGRAAGPASPPPWQAGLGASGPGEDPRLDLGPRLRLIAGTGSEAVSLLSDGGRWVVGRAHGVDLFLDDPDVSREHFEVVREADGSLALYDLGSKNGLVVNGRAVHEHRLAPEDEIRVGRSCLRFEA